MILRFPIFLALCLVLPAGAQTDPPKGPAAAFTPPKASPPELYRNLSENSPFTVRPDPVTVTEEEPFPDIKLIGYMPLGGKMNAWVQPADSEEPIQLVEGVRDEASGLLLLGIKGPESLYTAVAEVEAHGKKGSLRFTEAGITLAPGASAAKPGQAQQAQGGRPNPQMQGQPAQQRPTGPPPTTTPRRRIILPR